MSTDDRVCLVSPTGSGKSTMGAQIASHYGSVCWVAHRRELIDQARDTLIEWAPDTLRTVVTVQSVNRPSRELYDLLIVDECVTGDTRIGQTMAEHIRCGDRVPAIDHDTGATAFPRVLRIYQRIYEGNLIRLHIGATVLTCTDNHPIWIEGKGYVRAEEIIPGEVCCVRQEVRRYGPNRPRALYVLEGMQVHGVLKNHGGNESSIRLEEDACKQPNEPTRGQGQTIRDTQKNRARSIGAGRQREGSDCCRASHFQCDENANECDRSHWSAKDGGISNPLQDRCGQCETENSNRSRWSESPRDQSEASGCEEGCLLALARVDRVESVKQAGSTGITVYNFETEGVHTYFANNVLTHNCHHYAAEDWQNVITNVRHARLVGLSATPQRTDGKGLKGIFDRLVVSATYSELLALGHLCPCRITAGPEDKEGLAAQPLEAYQKHGEGRLTLAFAPTIALAEKWCEEFNNAGIPSACVFGKTADREDILNRFRSGQIRVVWNVSVLTEGFDVPAVDCVLLARSVGNAGLFVQITGRGLRPVPGKEYLRLIDLAGNYRVHGLPTEDRAYSLEGKAIRRAKVQKLRQCPACGGVAIAWLRGCPECQYVTPVRKMKLKIDNQALIEVFDGENTPVDAKDDYLDFLRAEQRKPTLKKPKGYTLQWVIGRYKKAFGRVPVIRDATPQEKAQYFRGLIFGVGIMRAKFMYKAVFGHLPP